MRCHHVKRNIDRMTVDGCALTEISFSTCPPQFSEGYCQTRFPLRISTASVWDTDGESSLDGESCKGWAKGVPLRVLPPWLETSRTYMRVPDPTMLFPIRRMGHSEDQYLSRSVYRFHGWIMDQLTSSRSGTSRIAEKVHEVSSGPWFVPSSVYR